MIDIPAAEIKKRIAEEKGLGEAEIEGKIKEKLEQLAGLISEDGAAHIVANELGVELDKTGGEATIGDLLPGMKSVTVAGKVTRKFELREFDKNGRQGKVANFLLADPTGQVRVTLWNEQTDQFGQLAEGETVRIKNAWVKENRGYKELHLNNDSSFQRNPGDVSVGEVQAGRPARERKQISELTGDEENVELLGTIVQLYDPRYFEVDPETGRRAQEGQEGTQTNYVLNAFLDDGTGNMRTTFWKNQAQRLLGKSDEEMLRYKENPQAFEQVKTEMLGEIVKVVGRCKKNETFDRVEFTANLVFTDIDPEEELQRIKESGAERPAAEQAPPAAEDAGAGEAPPATGAPAEEAPAKEPESSAAERPPDAATADDEVRSVGEEDAISLDDLEDLDEKL